jgi:UDP-N-acetylmuramoyl-L-alanyl-D-glutamate--2,6-diaminopimelate ligase
VQPSLVDAGLTTPEAEDISRLSRRVVAQGGTHLVMEVSSHALELGRVSALRFAAVALTNLTQDHLDFHGSMAAYAAAKRRLFDEYPAARAVLNVDDAFGSELAAALGSRAVSVSRTKRQADVVAESAAWSSTGISARVRLPGASVELESRLVGEHNLDNLLLALGIVHVLGLDVAAAARALATAPAVPGRLERCDEPGDPVVVLVDYAHTPDALERVLRASRGFAEGRLICVFGCGGDRDPDKRPRMGEAVGRLADRAIVTSDNPRSEKPEAIAETVVQGLRAVGASYDVVLDRRAAIQTAILDARPGDVVLLAGKGHEPYQIVGAEKRPFDDRDEARRALGLRRSRA